MPSVPTVKLNSGYEMPVIGLGTWQSPPDGTVYRAVKTAIEAGYRHLDCAYGYQNHPEIGKAINECIAEGKVKREELFVVSKVWLTFYKRDRVMACVKQILSDLNLSYLDLCLLHWPMSFNQVDDNLFPVDASTQKIIDGGVDFVEAWQGLEDTVKAGLNRSIGISNFNSQQIDRLLASATIKPVTNQVECHPYLSQKKLIKFCADRGITVTAYSPLGNPGSQFNKEDPKRGCLLREPLVTNLAQKYNKNVGQILLRFQVQRGVIVIPKSVTQERIVSNINIFDFELTPDEMDKLEALDCNYRTCAFAVMGVNELPEYPFGKIEF